MVALEFTYFSSGVDYKKFRMTIEDAGIGMTKADLVKNLGTVGYSGTLAFMKQMDPASGIHLKGRSGIGFYSVFHVASRVQVITKHDDDEQYLWVSSGGCSFGIRPNNDEPLVRGTKIILDIYPQFAYYLKPLEMKDSIIKYCGYTHYPIKLVANTEVIATIKDLNITREATIPREYDISRNEPLWNRDPRSVSTQEYYAFYAKLTHESRALVYKHFSSEGPPSFRGLLYIPAEAPHSYFSRLLPPTDIALYAKQVLIMLRCSLVVPDYLNFLVGVVDCDDICLSTTPRGLRRSSIFPLIYDQVTQKSMELLEDLSQRADVYTTFYTNFSRSLKLGVIKDPKNRGRLVNLLRFYSSKSNHKLTSLKDYVSRMKADQECIYYSIGCSIEGVSESPLIEGLLKRDIEVVYMIDAIDDYLMEVLHDYNGVAIMRVANVDLQVPRSNSEKKRLNRIAADFKSTCEKMESILGERVESVEVTDMLTASPCCIVTSADGWMVDMQRINESQPLPNRRKLAVNTGKKYLRINPTNPIIIRLKELLQKEEAASTTTTIADILTMLYNMALVRSGIALEAPKNYNSVLYKLIREVLE